MQKLIKNREGLEKQAMLWGIILGLFLLIIPLLTRKITFGAIIPSTMLSLSLAGFMWVRRQSRR